MGRRRKDNPLNLPPRVYAKHGGFYYVTRANEWIFLGTDVAEAKNKAKLYADNNAHFGTVAYYFDLYIIHCEARERAGDLKERTLADYKKDGVPLKAFFGKMNPALVEPMHIGQYLDLGIKMKRSVRANREKACFSAFFTWLVRSGETTVKQNPCFGIKRNKETPRARYVEHHEYQSVRSLAVTSVVGFMELCYRTLQRPEDILRWTPKNIVHKREPDGRMVRVIRHKPSKTATTTGAIIDIEITTEIDRVLHLLGIGTRVLSIKQTLISTRKGNKYTISGITSMLHRYIGRLGIESFGFQDLKAKGATDMYLSGVPMTFIQHLCGHASVTTTERYIKSRLRVTVQPNRTVVDRVG